MTSRTVDVTSADGTSIAVAVDGPSGDGPVPIVLVHGIVRSAAAWRWLLPTVPDHPVLRPDLRGHGGSDRAPGRYDLPGYAADLTAVLDGLLERPAVVVGHSLGGLTTAAVAQARPDAVAAVLLVDPALGLGRPWPDPDLRPQGPLIDGFHRQLVEAPAARAAGDPTEVHAARIAARPSGHGDTIGERHADGVPLARAEAELACDLDVLAPVVDPPPEHLGAGWSPDRGLTVPGIVLAADRRSPDRVTGRRDAEAVAAHCPAVEWREIAGAGHELQDERDHRATFVAALHEVLAISRRS